MPAGLVVIGAGLFDMVDGRVARETNRVTRFGNFFDSVLDRYSDLALLVGLLIYYASINRYFYVVLTAIVMTGTVLTSYARARAENTIPKCKVGFLERPERVVLIIGALANHMAPVLWVIAVLSRLITVIQPDNRALGRNQAYRRGLSLFGLGQRLSMFSPALLLGDGNPLTSRCTQSPLLALFHRPPQVPTEPHPLFLP